MFLLMVLILIMMIIIMAGSGIASGGIDRVEYGYCWN
jgi:hypothetical protein